VAVDTFYTVGLDDLAPHHDATGLVMGAGAGANYEFIDIADGCAKKWRKCPRQVRDLHGTQLSVYVAIPGIGTDYCGPGGTLGHRHSDMDYFHFVGTVRGLAVESNGASIELYVSELNLRFDLSLADLDGDSDATDGPATRAPLALGDAVTSSPPGSLPGRRLPDAVGHHRANGWLGEPNRARNRRVAPGRLKAEAGEPPHVERGDLGGDIDRRSRRSSHPVDSQFDARRGDGRTWG
jgi:hypothetical protein